MSTTIVRTREVLEITEIEDIRVSEIGEDGSGGYLRRISIYGSAGTENVPPALEIVVKSDAAGKIKVTTPEIDF